MKVLIRYTEIQHYSCEKIVDMTREEFNEYSQMNSSQVDEKLSHCVNDVSFPDSVESNYQFIELINYPAK